MKSVVTKGIVTQEWRVTGVPAGPFPPYLCIFHENLYPDAEAAARAFIDLAKKAHPESWREGPYLSSRWVTRSESEWEYE